MISQGFKEAVDKVLPKNVPTVATLKVAASPMAKQFQVTKAPNSAIGK